MTSTAADPLLQYTADIAPRPISEALLAARRDVMSAARDLATLTDADMEREWAWKGDSEIELRPAFYNVPEGFERAGIDAAKALRIDGTGRGRTAELIAPATAAEWRLQGPVVRLPDRLGDTNPGG